MDQGLIVSILKGYIREEDKESCYFYNLSYFFYSFICLLYSLSDSRFRSINLFYLHENNSLYYIIVTR